AGFARAIRFGGGPEGGRSPAPGYLAHLPAALEGLRQRHLVGVLEVAADREAAGDAGDPRREGLEQLAEVDGRGLALHARVGREDDLLDRLALEPAQELADLEVLGPDAVQRRERPQEHMVAAAKLPRAIEREEVVRLFDHAQEAAVAPGVATDAAGIFLGDVEAHLAG